MNEPEQSHVDMLGDGLALHHQVDLQGGGFGLQFVHGEGGEVGAPLVVALPKVHHVLHGHVHVEALADEGRRPSVDIEAVPLALRLALALVVGRGLGLCNLDLSQRVYNGCYCCWLLLYSAICLLFY